MKYMLLIYADETGGPRYLPEDHQAAAQAWYAFKEEAQSAGVLLSNIGLSPAAAATTWRSRSGRLLITDGPFAETPEQLAGYYLLDCKDLNEAIRWAARIPIITYGSIEIRPLDTGSQK